MSGINDMRKTNPALDYILGACDRVETMLNASDETARLAAENANLRELVEMAEQYINSIVEIADPNGTMLAGEWTEKSNYFSARAVLERKP